MSLSKMKWWAIYTNLLVNVIFRLSHPLSRDSQGQENMSGYGTVYIYVYVCIVYIYIYIYYMYYIYIHIYSVIPRHIFLSLNQNRWPKVSRTGHCQKTIDHAGKCILSQSYTLYSKRFSGSSQNHSRDLWHSRYICTCLKKKVSTKNMEDLKFLSREIHLVRKKDALN